MAYPKPLSKKSIERMYAASKLTREKIVFLHNFFDSCASLYGSICLGDMWEVYKELSEKTDVVKIQRKDIIAFSLIARREVHDYCVYEIDELYSAEERSDKNRYVILGEIIGNGKEQMFYQLDELQEGKPFYVPENLLELKGHVVTQEEKNLVDFIENLRATCPVIRNPWNEKMNRLSPHQGKKLKDFSFLRPEEEFKREWLSGEVKGGSKKCQQKKLDDFMASIQGTFAEKVFRDLRLNLFTGWCRFLDQVRYTMDNLTEVGVEFTENEADTFLQLVQDFNNNSHLYIDRGWTPSALSEYYRKMNPNQKLVITLGSGIREAIERGEISLEALKEQARVEGLEIQL